METSDDSIFLALVAKKRDKWEEVTLEISQYQVITEATRKNNNLESKKQSGTDAKSNSKKAEESKKKFTSLLASLLQAM